MSESTAPHALEPLPASAAATFTSLDWIATILAGNTGVFLLGFPFVAGHRFGAMYADFGTHVPLLTSLVIQGGLPVVAGVAVLALLVLGLRARQPVARRRAMIVSAFLVGGLGIALCFYGLYQPIWALAGQIKAS